MKDYEKLDGPKETTLKGVQAALQKIERCEELRKTTNDRQNDRQKGQNDRKNFNTKGNNGNEEKGGGKHANPCRKPGHDHDWKDCPDNWKNKKKDKPDRNKQEMNEMKRETSISSEDSDCTEESNCMRATRKESKTTTLSGEVLISVVRDASRENYVCLLDTGTSSSLMSDKLVGKNVEVSSNQTVKWETKAGEFRTTKEVLVKDCKLPQFTTSRKFEGKFNLFKKKT